MSEMLSEAELVASICRSDFKFFVKEFAGINIPGKFTWGWHLDVMCDHLQEVAERMFRGEGKKEDLVCNVSPGTTKSSIFSVLFPAWVWTRMPEAQFICVSYSHLLSLDLSRKCRDVVKSDKYRACFPDVILRDDADAKGYFINTAGGKRYSAGSRGTVLGMHAHFIIVDDPLDPTRALSEIELDTINYWMKTTLSSRKVDKSQSVTILVMQRLHQDDPSAQMLMRPDVKHICLPATTEYPIKPPELADKYIDGLMDPIRLPKAYLEEVSGPGGIGEAAYAGQYGQQPFPPGGNMFKVGNLRWGIAPDTFKRLVRAWDKAATVSKAISTKGPAYTVGTKLGLDYSGRIWVLDVRRVRVDSFKREELIKKTAIMDGREVIVVVEQEPGSGGKDSALGTIKRLMGYRVRAIPASGSKEIRADEFSVAVNGGLVWIPAMFRDGNHWVGWAYEWVEELKHFPHSSYLDQVDSASLGFGELARGRVRVGAITNTTQREFV